MLQVGNVPTVRPRVLISKENVWRRYHVTQLFTAVAKIIYVSGREGCRVATTLTEGNLHLTTDVLTLAQAAGQSLSLPVEMNGSGLALPPKIFCFA